MITARVSNIESFRRWREDEDQSVADLVRFITTDDPTPAMIAGTAFHAALEVAEPGEHDRLEAMGHTFVLEGGAIAIPPLREIRAYARYGELTVTGQCDVLAGLRIEDHKTTGRFDAERYLAGYQWRYYLDLFDAEVFRWNIFEIREVGDRVYTVAPPQIIEAHRYPGMRSDCMRLAADYFEFAIEHLDAGSPSRQAA